MEQRINQTDTASTAPSGARRSNEPTLGIESTTSPLASLRVALFYTCLVDMMRPEIAFASVRLLEDAGCKVEVPLAQTCCGQPGFNAGDQHVARDLALQWLGMFESFDYVVVPSGSCAGMVRK
ncbi:MAG: heterodisulfide reductase-related iron-sulfur binding cluster, partial [Burkholderiales bacterium]